MAEQPRPMRPGFYGQQGMAPTPFGSPSQFAQFTTPQYVQPFQLARTQGGQSAAAGQMSTIRPNGQHQNTNTTQTIDQVWQVPSILKPLAPQPIDLNQFEGFRFATLDPLLACPRNIYLFISGESYWYPFEHSQDSCFEHIKTECNQRRVFLLTTGGSGQTIVPKIHDFPQVYAIYIYCANVAYHCQWAKSYKKVRVVADQDDVYLIPQFAVDVAQANADWADALLQAGNRTDAKEKYEKAVNILTHYGRRHDPQMLSTLQQKLNTCQ